MLLQKSNVTKVTLSRYNSVAYKCLANDRGESAICERRQHNSHSWGIVDGLGRGVSDGRGYVGMKRGPHQLV
jgi:hypothetical protein